MRLRLVVVTLVILALAAPVMVLADSKAEQEIRAVLDQSEQANLKGGTEAAATLDKLLTDDYMRINAYGTVLNKSDILNGFRTGKQTNQTYDNSDIKIRVYGNTAVATGILNQKSEGPISGPGAFRSRWTRVLVKRGGTWQVALYQNTKIAEAGKQ